MKTMLELITTEMEAAFEKAGYDKELAKVTLSNRPDLCEYQCNGAMAGAKKYKKAPFMIAEDVAVYLKESSYFETVEVVKPGFINLKLAPQSVADYLNQMSETEKLGVEEAEEPKNDHDRLRRTECCETASCRTSAFCNYRRKRKTDYSF